MGRGIDHMPLGERLLEEDENLVRMETRRDALQSIVQEDLQNGKQPDQGIVRQIISLTRQVKELKTLQVI